MTFVFPILLGGLLLVGVPILLHLIMRQKPRRMPFPAFRFLVKRHRTNLRKLRLRHLLLLAMRVLLLAAICFALARPKLFFAELNLSSDSPVAAVFVMDTSSSMEYRTSDQQTRLEEAKKRALELLDELPDGSRVAILDSAETISTRGNWLTSMNQAQQRINNLKLQHNNAPLNRSVLAAYRMFAELVRNPEDETAGQLPRLMCIFSDRTRSSWDASQQQIMHEAHDQVPPSLEGLHQLRGDIPALIDELGELRKRLPPRAGQDYAEQSLINSLEELRGSIPDLRREDLATDADLARLVPGIRRGARELLATLQPMELPQADPARTFRDRLVSSLERLTRQVQGVYTILVDVGVDKPIDLAIVDLQLPRSSSGQERQIFNDDEKVIIRVVVQATGKDYDNEVVLQQGGNAWRRSVSVKAGERKTVPFELDLAKLRLAPGMHQVEVRLSAADLLPFNNSRFLTFAVREPQRVLIVSDDSNKPHRFRNALETLRYRADVKLVQALAKEEAAQELLRYDAVYLFSTANPPPALWQALENYVSRGGRLGIVPGGNELNVDAYRHPSALKLLPAAFKSVVAAPGADKGGFDRSGVGWDLSNDAIYQHTLMKPFHEWRFNQSIDFIKHPRQAYHYWEVQRGDEAQVLVEYADDKNRPALLERRFDKGKGGRVLQFTTTLDSRDPQWNNYPEQLTSFYLVLTALSTRYLAGELEEANLNFQSGQDVPTVRLPLDGRFPDYIVRGPVFERTAGGDSLLRLEKADQPGNYLVEGVKSAAESGREVARFSVNVPPAQSDLTRVPAAEIDSVLGPKAVTNVERRANIRESLRGHFTEPLELFPYLMILILIVLALENLLANKFYRRESLPETTG